MTTLYKTITLCNKPYEISSTGGVKCLTTNTQLKLSKVPRGYLICQIWDKSCDKYKRYLIHRLVAECFIDNPLNLRTVNHIDGNKTNNCVDNLEWLSISDNMKHGHATGLIKPRGEDNGMAKITKEIALLIYNAVGTNKCIGQQYNISDTTVWAIKNKTRWQHIHN